MLDIVIDCRMWGKGFGGIGRYTKEIVTFINANKANLKVGLLCSKAALSDLINLDENIQIINFEYPIFSIKEQLNYNRKIPPCNLFWTPYINIPFFSIKAKKRIVTIHDVFHVANPKYYNLVYRTIIKIYYKLAIKRSNTIITVSQFSKNEICKYFGENAGQKTIVIYNGCNSFSFNVNPPATTYKYILFVGNIKPHKNIKNALLAFEKIDNKSIRFVIVGKKEGYITGDKEVFSIIDRLNRKSDKVIFTGNIDDDKLNSYYKGAKMLIMPSFYEGFGLPIVEAMFFNLPIVCSDIEVFREIGNNLVSYFNPSDIYSIKRAIEKKLMMNEPINYPTWKSWRSTGADVLNVFNSIK